VVGDAVVVVGVPAGDDDGAAPAVGETTGVLSVVAATDGVADASAMLFELPVGWETSLVVVGVVIGVTGVAGRDLVLRYQMSAVKPRRMVATSSRTRARGLKAIYVCLPKILR
jgi:hypothetical protein